MVSPSPARFFHADAAHRTARLTLVAGYDGSNNGFNFDGYARGQMLVTVPSGWRVVIHCENRGPLRNSCAVVRGASDVLAFPGAQTRMPKLGLEEGDSATFSFLAGRAGAYRLVSLVAGHALARQWAVLKVVRRGHASIAARAGP